MHYSPPSPLIGPRLSLPAMPTLLPGLGAVLARLQRSLSTLLHREPAMPDSAARVMAMAARYDHTQPGFAADLRAAPRRSAPDITRAC